MAMISRYPLARPGSLGTFFIVSLALIFLVSGVTAKPPSPISIAFEKDGSMFDEGYVIPVKIANGAHRTDLIVSTSSTDIIAIITNSGTCAKPNITALSCFPETSGMNVAGMDMSMPQGPAFEWNDDSLGLYARGNSGNSSIQLSSPGSLEPLVKVDGLQLYYTTPAESNLNYGLLGLGKQSTMLRYLTSKRLITSNAYGLYLGAELQSTGSSSGNSVLEMPASFPGSLVLGGYDKRQFGGKILGGKLSGTNLPRIEVSNIVLHTKSVDGASPQSPETITVDVDSTTPDLHLPETMVRDFADDIGAGMEDGYYGYETWGSKYVGNVTMKIRVPSSLNLTSPSIDGAVQELDITIAGGEFYQLRPTNYISNRTAATQKPKYYLPMRPTTKRLVFGRAFLRSMHLVVDYDKGEWYLGPVAWGGGQELVPIVSSWYTAGGSGEKSKSKVGVIVGGVLGGIAAILILAGAIYWWSRRRRQGDAHDDGATADDPQYQQYGQQAGPQGEVPMALPGYLEVKGDLPAAVPDRDDRGELEA